MPSVFNVIEWLNDFAGLTDSERLLDEETLRPILAFVLMWNLFESSACQRNASRQKIKEVAEYLQEEGIIKREEISEFLDYFAARYLRNGQENRRFPFLRFRSSSDRQFVRNVLSRPNDFQESELLTAILMIVYRYRNNLFHGEKWVYSLRDQAENFSIANRVLAWVLESLNEVASNSVMVRDPVRRIAQYISRKQRT